MLVFRSPRPKIAGLKKYLQYLSVCLCCRWCLDSKLTHKLKTDFLQIYKIKSEYIQLFLKLLKFNPYFDVKSAMSPTCWLLICLKLSYGRFSNSWFQRANYNILIYVGFHPRKLIEICSGWCWAAFKSKCVFRTSFYSNSIPIRLNRLKNFNKF